MGPRCREHRGYGRVINLRPLHETLIVNKWWRQVHRQQHGANVTSLTVAVAAAAAALWPSVQLAVKCTAVDARHVSDDFISYDTTLGSAWCAEHEQVQIYNTIINSMGKNDIISWIETLKLYKHCLWPSDSVTRPCCWQYFGQVRTMRQDWKTLGYCEKVSRLLRAKAARLL